MCGYMFQLLRGHLRPFKCINIKFKNVISVMGSQTKISTPFVAKHKLLKKILEINKIHMARFFRSSTAPEGPGLVKLRFS
jgi:hypothetical protein